MCNQTHLRKRTQVGAYHFAATIHIFHRLTHKVVGLCGVIQTNRKCSKCCRPVNARTCIYRLVFKMVYWQSAKLFCLPEANYGVPIWLCVKL